MISCNFTNNSARRGGAVYLGFPSDTGPGTMPRHQLTQCTFAGNVATSDGGAVFIDSLLASSAVTMSQCRFAGNTAQRGGAWFSSSGSVAITQNGLTYTNNTAAAVHGSDYAAGFNHFELVPDTSIVSNVNTSTVAELQSGGKLNSTLSIVARDLYGQMYRFGGGDAVLLTQVVVVDAAGAVDPHVRLLGETTKAVFTGQARFQNIEVYGSPGAYRLAVARVRDLDAPEVAIVARSFSIQPCLPPQQLVPSVAHGPDYSVCASGMNWEKCMCVSVSVSVRVWAHCTTIGADGMHDAHLSTVVCSRGCSAYGQCMAPENCTCTSPAYEGIACQLRVDLADSIVLQLAAEQYALSVGTRDALVDRLAVLLPPGHTVVFRSFRQSTPSTLAFAFSVVRTDDGTYVQAQTLDAVRVYLANALLSRTALGPGQSDPYRFVWPPPSSAFALQQVTVDKASVTASNLVGGGLLSLIVVLIGLTVAATVLLLLRRDHAIVRNVGTGFLVATALAIVCLYVTLLQFLGVPSSAKCTSQIVFGHGAIALALSTLLCRAMHARIMCDNPVQAVADFPSAYVRQYTVMVLAAVAANLVCILLALLCVLFGEHLCRLPQLLAGVYTALTAPAPVVLTSEATGPYWTCALIQAPQAAAVLGTLVAINAALFGAGLCLSWQARRGESLAREPRFLLLNYWNVMLCTVVLASLEMGMTSLSPSTRFVIRCVLGIGLLSVWTGTWLVYKVYRVYVKQTADEPTVDLHVHLTAAKDEAVLGRIEQVCTCVTVPRAAVVWHRCLTSCV